ncbi:MAG: NADH-quinone oxidoreductase subunit L [Planctomycetota bacterium]|nr:NADH-quinone oxidoreductase subunit L [Planctomycetota bacterium]
MDALFAVKYSFLIPLLPLIGAAIAGFAGAKLLRGQSHWPIWLGVGASAVISLSLLFQMLGMMHGGEHNLSTSIDWYTWIDAGRFKATAGFFFDPLTAIMLSVVTGIGFFITVFAAGYMKGETGYFRFFAYLGLFIFAMTCLVMGNNFIMLYLGWEGVGLCSYLLIGYYYERPSAVEAAKKAFLVNRIGDFGFGLGIMLIWKAFHSVSFFGAGYGTHTGVFEMARMALADPTNPAFQYQIHCLHYIPFLLMLGAFGKSAQFPLYVWLPDAMEGPTPVSALIHAATMVTAGIYMIARCGVLFVSNEAAMTTIACIGAFTALLAATIALRQFDLKKVFAYSTVSQLGFMFVGVGVMAPVAGVFHLITHAFFKALLFLSSGVVMHAMAGELDMRKMSGLKRVLPLTRIFILVGCLALAGFPFLSGFFSKDEIVGLAFARSVPLGLVMLFTAFLTAYYTFRLYYRVFEGPLEVPPPAPAIAHAHSGHGPDVGDAEQSHASHDHDHTHGSQGHADDGHHDHEPLIMMIPLAVLAFGAIFAGYLNFPSTHLGNFLGNSPSLIESYDVASAHYATENITISAEAMGQHPMDAAGEKPEPVISPIMVVSGLVALVGIGLAYFLHLKDRTLGERIAESFGPLTRLLEHKYWIDEIYQAGIVEPLRWVGMRFFDIDRIIVDGLVATVSLVPQFSGFAVKLTTQRGYLQGYAATMLLGLAAILLLIFHGI